jgi:hypothetical protein
MTQLLYEDLSSIGQLLYNQQIETPLWTDMIVVEPIK